MAALPESAPGMPTLCGPLLPTPLIPAIWPASAPITELPWQRNHENSSSEDTQERERGQEAALSKTKLCKFFNRGACQRGEECTFAHGRGQLQRRPPPAVCRKQRDGTARAAAPRGGSQERRRGGAERREAATERRRAQLERDAMARQLAEARFEAAQLRLQVQSLLHRDAQLRVGAGHVGLAQHRDADLTPRPEHRFEADLTAEGGSHDEGSHDESPRAERLTSLRDDSGVMFTVKNTFLDVASSVDASEHHRRTSSVPPRNQWLDLWLQHVSASEATR